MKKKDLRQTDEKNLNILLAILKEAFTAQEGFKQRKSSVLHIAILLTVAILALFASPLFPGKTLNERLLTGDIITTVLMAVLSLLFACLTMIYAKCALYDNIISHYIVTFMAPKAPQIIGFSEAEKVELLNIPLAIYPRTWIASPKIIPIVISSTTAASVIAVPGILLWVFASINCFRAFRVTTIPWWLYILVGLLVLVWPALVLIGRSIAKKWTETQTNYELRIMIHRLYEALLNPDKQETVNEHIASDRIVYNKDTQEEVHDYTNLKDLYRKVAALFTDPQLAVTSADIEQDKESSWLRYFYRFYCITVRWRMCDINQGEHIISYPAINPAPVKGLATHRVRVPRLITRIVTRIITRVKKEIIESSVSY